MTVRWVDLMKAKTPVREHRLMCVYPGCDQVYRGPAKKVRALMKAHRSEKHQPRRGK